MVDQKPLPATPIHLTLLTVDARNHRARLIRHLLSGVHEPGLENRRDGWTIVLEEVLDEFSQHLAKDDWLGGTRKAREQRRISRRSQRLEALQQEATLKDTVKAKAKQGTKNDVKITPDSESSEITKDGSFEVLPTSNHKDFRTRSHSPLDEPNERHMLLCVAPLGGRTLLPTEDSGFDLVPANIGCSFIPGVFSLPGTDDATILYGSSQMIGHHGIRVIGGTFLLKGVNSTLQCQLLSQVLRISVYIHLSLILEQHFLLDSHISLSFPRPRLPSPSPSVPSHHSTERTITTEPKTKKQNSFLPSSILSFFSKGGMSHRSSTIMPILGQGRYFDLGIPVGKQVRQEEHTPRSSMEAGGASRLRRFSIIGDRQPKQPPEDVDLPLSDALKKIRESGELLSTSPGVLFAPPTLIVELAEKEKNKPSRRLKGDEKVGLSSLLGWDGKESRGKGMSGTPGFLRQQALSVLWSQHVPNVSSPMEAEKSSSLSVSSSSSSPKSSLLALCGRPSWRSYRYYSQNNEEDTALGETIFDFVASAQEPCAQSKCQYKRHQHEQRLIHGGVLVIINIREQKELIQDNSIQVWESCASCDARSKPSGMTDGTYLLSFGKFLELLIYSPALCTPSPALCEHTTPPLRPWPVLPASRLNIVRHFSCQSYNVSFTLSTIAHIFELRVPRLQMNRGGKDNESNESIVSGSQSEVDKDKKDLRREIKRWWEDVAGHMDKLETILSDGSAVPYKALPRLPSSDDAYSRYDEGEELPKTLKFDSRIGLPSSSLGTPDPPTNKADGHLLTTPTGGPTLPSTPTNQACHRLSAMRHTFHRTEQTLYSQLSRTPASSLNDVRRSFLYAARGAHKRLSAWQKKHIPLIADHNIPELASQEPEWWDKKCHAVPGGNVIVREDDCGSIISFTLSTADYQHELSNMSVHRNLPQTTAPDPSPTTHSSFFSAAVGLFTSSTHTQLDPDQEDVTWSEPEAFSSVISRTEHPREPTTILSIREVLRQKSPTDGIALPISRFGSVGSSAARGVSSTPSSAWTKPDVQISMDAADGEVAAIPDTIELAGKILQEIETASNGSSRPSSRASEMSSAPIDSHINRGRASSIISAESDVTIGREHGSTIKLPMPPPPPPKDSIYEWEKPKDGPNLQPTGHTTKSSFASTLAGGLNNAMRLMLNSGDTSQSSSPSVRNHHGLLLADVANIDERPHIKYDWTIGKRLKFSCTVYYAKQFDLLRRRCGIDDIFLKSLSRSKNWAADGGKSRSNFWKTDDDRFIIKTLVDAWNVADLQVLIELAPSYFRYMEATASKPTVLAKMIGFYTVEIRNLETGAIQSKSDLLVMENLFYDQKVVKTFDLKGIQGRKVKTGGVRAPLTSKTLFDGEWIEGQQKTLMLVRPHSKQILQMAIKSDAEYLSKSNIMDYSLLVGVDEEHKQIACGLVDTIGSYTFAKTLEYKAKHGLNSGKDITVIPPVEYQERFVSALDGYFLACPDKWSRPLDETKILSDPSHLSSVL